MKYTKYENIFVFVLISADIAEVFFKSFPAQTVLICFKFRQRKVGALVPPARKPGKTRCRAGADRLVWK